MLRLNQTIQARTRRRLPWEDLAASKGVGRGPCSFHRQSERRLRKQQRRRDGRRRNDAVLLGIHVALRELAVNLKKWAQNEQMMGSNYPSVRDSMLASSAPFLVMLAFRT